jgi:carbonic anhydrase
VADPNVIDTLGHAGIDLQKWLVGFERVEDGVRQSVDIIRNHPLVPRDVPVHGLIIDPATGKLDSIVDGYEPPPIQTP